MVVKEMILNKDDFSKPHMSTETVLPGFQPGARDTAVAGERALSCLIEELWPRALEVAEVETHCSFLLFRFRSCPFVFSGCRALGVPVGLASPTYCAARPAPGLSAGLQPQAKSF